MTTEVSSEDEAYLESQTEAPLHEQFSTEELVEGYLEIKDKIKAEEDALKERTAPMKALLTEIEDSLSLTLERAGGESLKTAKGSAGFRTYTSYKVVDRATLDNYTKEHGSAAVYESRVSKEVVEQIVADTGVMPAGVEASSYTKVVVTRPRSR